MCLFQYLEVLCISHPWFLRTTLLLLDQFHLVLNIRSFKISNSVHSETRTLWTHPGFIFDIRSSKISKCTHSKKIVFFLFYLFELNRNHVTKY